MRPILVATMVTLSVAMTGCTSTPANRAEAPPVKTDERPDNSPSLRWVNDTLALYDYDAEYREAGQRFVLGMIDFLIADAQKHHTGPRGVGNGSPTHSEDELRSIMYEHPELYEKRAEALRELLISEDHK